jgi:hypothetical protein
MTDMVTLRRGRDLGARFGKASATLVLVLVPAEAGDEQREGYVRFRLGTLCRYRLVSRRAVTQSSQPHNSTHGQPPLISRCYSGQIASSRRLSDWRAHPWVAHILQPPSFIIVPACRPPPQSKRQPSPWLDWHPSPSSLALQLSNRDMFGLHRTSSLSQSVSVSAAFADTACS